MPTGRCVMSRCWIACRKKRGILLMSDRLLRSKYGLQGSVPRPIDLRLNNHAVKKHAIRLRHLNLRFRLRPHLLHQNPRFPRRVRWLPRLLLRARPRRAFRLSGRRLLRRGSSGLLQVICFVFYVGAGTPLFGSFERVGFIHGVLRLAGIRFSGSGLNAGRVRIRGLLC